MVDNKLAPGPTRKRDKVLKGQMALQFRALLELGLLEIDRVEGSHYDKEISKLHLVVN